MMPRFVAYFTEDTPYAHEAELLRESFDALGLSYWIVGIKSLGNWQANTQYKSRFIRDMLAAHPDQPLVYIDVDALVLQRPTLFESLDCDVAAAKLGGWELLSGTVYFGGTPKCREIVDRWGALCEQYPQTFPGGLLPHFPGGEVAWDQRMLDLAIRQTEGVRFVELPPAYTYIDGLSTDKYPGVQSVIRHTRGSMRLRHLVDA